MTTDALKAAAAAEALKLVEPGMRLGLGTGSTAKQFVDLLGARVKAGLDVVCVATSLQTETQAKALGIHVVPLGPNAVGSISRAIKAGHVVCLLSDRDIGGGGPEVEFFGERTRLPAGPVTLALRTGAPLLPTAVYETAGNRVRGVVRPPMDLAREGRLRADVARLTQALAYELEELIAAEPQQWHLQSPNWPSDVEALRAAGYSPEPLPGTAPQPAN